MLVKVTAPSMNDALGGVGVRIARQKRPSGHRDGFCSRWTEPGYGHLVGPKEGQVNGFTCLIGEVRREGILLDVLGQGAAAEKRV